MRLSAEWMTIVDERVLEFLNEEGPRQPKQIANDDRISYSSEYIGRRCRKLAEVGLLENLGNGVYMITQHGQAYLNEELDARTLTPKEE